MRQTKQSEDYLYGLWKKAYQNDDQVTIDRLKHQFRYDGSYRYTAEKQAEAEERAAYYDKLFGQIGYDPDDDVIQFSRTVIRFDIHNSIIDVKAYLPDDTEVEIFKGVSGTPHTTITSIHKTDLKSKNQILKENNL